MQSFIKRLYHSIPWVFKDRIEYYRSFRSLPNLTKPIKFTEKVLYRKKTTCITNDNYALYADKLRVRNYVESKIGSAFLILLLGTYHSVDELKKDLYSLKKCILKPNNASGCLIFIDEGLIPVLAAEVLITASVWLNNDYSRHKGEFHYKKIQPVLIAEKNIDMQSKRVNDYKIHMFRVKEGHVFYVIQMVEYGCVDQREGKGNTFFFVNNLFSSFGDKIKIFSADEKKALIEALKNSEILLGELEYARFDWYITRQGLYFGEITLTPCAGFCKGFPEELDLLMGSVWCLPDKHSNDEPDGLKQKLFVS